MKLLLLALSGVAATFYAGGASANELAKCTAQRLVPFVSPFGISQPWPTASSLPSESELSSPVPLSGMGDVADGYTHTLYVHGGTKSSYVVQVGGIAGAQTIYGPLPVAVCQVVSGS